MKRFQMGLIAVAVMALAATAACAAVQEFTHFTMDIPEGWTAKEDGPTVGIIKDDQTASLAVSVDALHEGDTIKDLAAAMSKYMEGTTPEADADGDYHFTAHDGQIQVIVTGDNDAGVYAAFTMVGLETQREAIGGMISSIKFKK